MGMARLAAPPAGESAGAGTSGACGRAGAGVGAGVGKATFGRRKDNVGAGVATGWAALGAAMEARMARTAAEGADDLRRRRRVVGGAEEEEGAGRE
ncbi:hypothetical protein BOTBODRAFT_284888 [Botryobasidium botryosum FD-172 SS1]|uniref:Uncharacterized protein n=1 Tax=Botryobasidium botryosum (strain FD-172 SS1) TaxID=930990 RepID=A0A067MVT0_BOTB1|nr:hypothetical protein BOTBODRAFT_284888 [Botryobasidium botryosum FD-172 SS1]